MAAKLIRVQPRASVELPHEALAATEGGPLAVKESNGDRKDPSGLELMEPRFVANIRLATADAEESACGQRGYARLGRRSDTMGRWLVATTRDWFEAKLRVE